MASDSADEAGWSPAETPRGVRSNHMHDHDTDDLDFAMLTPPTRPGPCKAATAPEVDPVERRLEREREAGPYRCASPVCPGRNYKASEMRHPCPPSIEVQHGSGKVKV